MSEAGLKLGRWGENLAAEYLTQKGYIIIGRNVRTPYGEIDLVARYDATDQPSAIVFIEVKTRQSDALGPPEISVTPQKQARLISAAQAYLLAHPELVGDWRVDVVAIRGSHRKSRPEIVHFENAFAGN
jgi:putative endonuclease